MDGWWKVDGWNDRWMDGWVIVNPNPQGAAQTTYTHQWVTKVTMVAMVVF